MNKNLDLGDNRTDTVSSLVQPAFSEAEREMGRRICRNYIRAPIHVC